MRIEPMTLKLWDNNASCCTTMTSQLVMCRLNYNLYMFVYLHGNMVAQQVMLGPYSFRVWGNMSVMPRVLIRNKWMTFSITYQTSSVCCLRLRMLTDFSVAQVIPQGCFGTLYAGLLGTFLEKGSPLLQGFTWNYWGQRAGVLIWKTDIYQTNI